MSSNLGMSKKGIWQKKKTEWECPKGMKKKKELLVRRKGAGPWGREKREKVEGTNEKVNTYARKHATPKKGRQRTKRSSDGGVFEA